MKVKFLGLAGLVTVLSCSGCSLLLRSQAPAFLVEWSQSATQSIAQASARMPPKSEEISYLKYELPRREPNAALSVTPLLWHDTGEGAANASGSVSDSEPATVNRTESLFSTDYLKLVVTDAKQVFTAPAQWETRDWFVAGGVAAGIGLTMAFDPEIQKAVQRNRSQTIDDIFNAVEPFGTWYSAALLGGFYAGGALFKDPTAQAVALDGISASIIASGLITEPLKYTVGRSRPYSNKGAYDFHPFSGADSFPSGHATEAFAVATVITEHYPFLWVKISSYGLASAVGYARMNSRAHWASDVLAGAAIGTFTGEVVVRFNKGYRHVELAPLIGPGFKGAELVWSF